MTTASEDARSTIILALCNLPRKRLGITLIESLEGLPEHHWRDQRKQADAILSALASEGWELVRAYSQDETQQIYAELLARQMPAIGVGNMDDLYDQ